MLASTLYPASALSRLVILRWVTIAAQTFMLALATAGWGIPLPLPPMIAGICLLILINLGTTWRLKNTPSVNDRELFSHLCIDVGVLAWLLYFAGGSTNPFISLLLVPLTIAAVALPRRFGWATAGLALGIYSLLVFFNQPLPPPDGRLKTLDQLLSETCGVGSAHAGHGEGFALHVVGMWLNFIISALIIAVFLNRQASALRDRERELQNVREKALRQEKVLALGLQAAGAAHKLGTPLSTIAVLIREMERDAPLEEATENILLLKNQIQRCKGILAEIVAAGETPSPLTAEQWIRNLVSEWLVLRPEVHMQALDIRQDETPPLVQPDRSMDQALQSLLDNAANASPEGVSLQLDWDRNQLEIRIQDQGSGIDSRLSKLLGQDFIAQEESSGLGIGFFLTNATIEHFGGTVEITPGKVTGSCIRVCLPLERLCK